MVLQIYSKSTEDKNLQQYIVDEESNYSKIESQVDLPNYSKKTNKKELSQDKYSNNFGKYLFFNESQINDTIKKKEEPKPKIEKINYLNKLLIIDNFMISNIFFATLPDFDEDSYKSIDLKAKVEYETIINEINNLPLSELNSLIPRSFGTIMKRETNGSFNNNRKHVNNGIYLLDNITLYDKSEVAERNKYENYIKDVIANIIKNRGEKSYIFDLNGNLSLNDISKLNDILISHWDNSKVKIFTVIVNDEDLGFYNKEKFYELHAEAFSARPTILALYNYDVPEKSKIIEGALLKTLIDKNYLKESIHKILNNLERGNSKVDAISRFISSLSYYADQFNNKLEKNSYYSVLTKSDNIVKQKKDIKTINSLVNRKKTQNKKDTKAAYDPIFKRISFIIFGLIFILIGIIVVYIYQKNNKKNTFYLFPPMPLVKRLGASHSGGTCATSSFE